MITLRPNVHKRLISQFTNVWPNAVRANIALWETWQKTGVDSQNKAAQFYPGWVAEDFAKLLTAITEVKKRGFEPGGRNDERVIANIVRDIANIELAPSATAPAPTKASPSGFEGGDESWESATPIAWNNGASEVIAPESRIVAKAPEVLKDKDLHSNNWRRNDVDTVFQRKELDDMDHNIPAKEWDKRVRGKQGCLRPTTLSIQGLFYTKDARLIAHIIANGVREGRETFERKTRQVMQGGGAVIFPYSDPRELGPDAFIWNRLRAMTPIKKGVSSTGKEILEKYSSSDGAVNEVTHIGPYNPPYPILPMYDAVALRRYDDEIYSEIQESTGVKLSKEVIEGALTQLGYYEMPNWVADKSIPILAIEGEYKAMSTFEALQEGFKACVIEAVKTGQDLKKLDLSKLTLPPKYVPFGLIGVNGCIQRIGGKKTGNYCYRKEWTDVLDLQGREVIFGADNDLAVKVSVAHCATTVACGAENVGGFGSLCAIPADAGDDAKGADDFITKYGHLAFLDVVRNRKRLRAANNTDFKFNDIDKVFKNQGTVADFITLPDTMPKTLSKSVKIEDKPIISTVAPRNSFGAAPAGQDEFGF